MHFNYIAVYINEIREFTSEIMRKNSNVLTKIILLLIISCTVINNKPNREEVNQDELPAKVKEKLVAK
ncbi:hypothetical protein DX931_24615 [Bacillus cereus]|nr:hypothetical protein DX930_24300 [Bacillus cereus]KAA6472396.1 hypothetical protein DX931_24615 [Bacillus cereus]